MFRHSLSFAMLILLSTQLTAEDARVKRSIRKEPFYQSSPRYCLLLLGTEPVTSVWLALDGEMLYADLNGNGDLTEPQERLAPQKPSSKTPVFKIDSILDRSGHTHTDLFLGVEEDGEWQLQIDVDDSTRQRAFIDEPSKKPRKAPVVHFGGPMKMTLWKAKTLTFSRKKPTKLGALIVTDYDDVESAYVTAGVPESVDPEAEITFTSKANNKESVIIKVPLAKRDSTLFFEEIRVPASAAGGKAKVVLSFADWRDQKIASATFEVSVVTGTESVE